MRITSIIAVLAFATQARAKDSMDMFADQFINNLVDQLLGSTQLGMPSQLAISQKSSAPLPRSILRAGANSGPRSYTASVPKPPAPWWGGKDSPWNPLRDKREVVHDPKVEGNKHHTWKLVYANLLERNLTSLNGLQALEMMQDQGAVLVDVRHASAFQKETIEGAINVPMFRPVQGNTLWHNAKRFTTGFMGLEAREHNPDFAALAAKLPRDKPIILTCDRGGILTSQADMSASFGDANSLARYTLSLKAAYEFYEMGFKKVYFLQGGVQGAKAEANLHLAPGGKSSKM